MEVKDIVENKSLMDLVDVLTKASIKFSDKIVEKAPEAWDALLTMTQISGFVSLVGLVIWVLASIISAVMLFKMKKNNVNGVWPLLLIPNFVCLFISYLHITSFSMWLKIFAPEGYIMLALMETAGINLRL